MVNFNELSRLSLGHSGLGPYRCSSYCVLNDRLFLSLFEPLSKKGKIVVLSVNNSGQLSIVDSSEIYPSGPFNIAHTDGIFTDGSYVYQCLTTDEAEVIGNKRTLAWGFSGDTLVYPTVIVNTIHSGHGQMTFGDGYIFTYTTVSHPYPNVIGSFTFNGTAWAFKNLDPVLTPGYPLFFSRGRVLGVKGGGYLDFLWTEYDSDLGFGDPYSIGEWLPGKPLIIHSRYWNLIDNTVMTLELGLEGKHTYDPGLPNGVDWYYSEKDNSLSVCTTNGLYYYETEDPYKFFGIYEPTKSFQFHFKFESYDILLDNDMVSGEHQIKSGKIIYYKDYTANFYSVATIGNNPLTTFFADTSD